ncbi:MAG: hypothetical protein WBM00_07585 [Solirubrobacterales bacterium]
MRIKIVVAAVLGLLLFAGVAEGAYQLRFGYAKRAIQQYTAEVCRGLEGCNDWRVGPCTRRSLHRIDCVSRVFSHEGGACAWVTIAVLPPIANEVQLHHKRILC